MSRWLVAFAAVGLVAGTAGCGTDGGDAPNPKQSASRLAHPDVGSARAHIHALAQEPSGRLLMGTHRGLFAARPGSADGVAVGAYRGDLVGLARVGHLLLASGHPGAQAHPAAPVLGLIESVDAGHSWREVALRGVADFHLIRASGPQLYGLNSLAGSLMVSGDGGRNWGQRVLPAAMTDMAVNPRRPDQLIASTSEGLAISFDAGRSWPVRRPMAAGTMLAWTGDRLVSLAPQGRLRTSTDLGRTWQPGGRVRGQPVALTAVGDRLLVARDDGTVVQSSDGGASWRLRARL